ncbi:MAG TPA: SAM-dependent methyltransferase [Acidimicrobiales bacterium]|jgi:methyltransferase (TIGR00027 family)
MKDDAVLRNVSDTALLVANMRAVETMRQHPLFRDPFAHLLAGERGRRIAPIRSRLVPSGAVVARTALLDELILHAVEANKCAQILNFGAGLDTRPYRLSLPEDLRWIEVDLPAILDYKSELLKSEQPRCQLKRTSVDLADSSARQAFFRQVLDGRPTLVVCEGLLPYLRPDDVAGIADDLAHQPDIELWCVHMVSSLALRWGNRLGGKTMAAADATGKFAPEEGLDFFASHGWTPTKVWSMWLEQRRLGREPRPMRMLWNVSPPKVRRVFDGLEFIALLGRC